MSEAGNDLHLDTLLLKKAALILKAGNHALRQKMLHHLHQQGKLPVTDIYLQLRLEQSIASQHLAVLRRAGYVASERNGRNVYYSVNYARLRQIHRFAQDLLN